MHTYICVSVWQEMPNKQIYSELTFLTNVPGRLEVWKCWWKILLGFCAALPQTRGKKNEKSIRHVVPDFCIWASELINCNFRLCKTVHKNPWCLYVFANAQFVSVFLCLRISILWYNWKSHKITCCTESGSHPSGIYTKRCSFLVLLSAQMFKYTVKIWNFWREILFALCKQ